MVSPEQYPRMIQNHPVEALIQTMTGYMIVLVSFSPSVSYLHYFVFHKRDYT